MRRLIEKRGIKDVSGVQALVKELTSLLPRGFTRILAAPLSKKYYARFLSPKSHRFSFFQLICV